MSKTRPLIAIYARYSSDLQNPSSVDDQIALCKRLIGDQFKASGENIIVFSDAAISGATMERPGLRRLISSVERRPVGMVVAEGLDRISRSLKDIAAIHETLSYHRVALWTAHEGHVSELHVGLKGTMNAMFLKDMKQKVKRGQAARADAGFAPGSCAYGYRVVRGVVDAKGRNINGVREIDPDAAEIIRRVYREYLEGRTIVQMVAGLNADSVPAPNGGLWKRNALMGGASKREGILRNEIYTGKLIANRHYVMRDPVTGRKKYVLNPESEWKKVDVPHLRIIDDAQWEKVRLLDLPRAHEKKPKVKKTHPLLTRYNQHAMTDWVKCGWCGGPKSLANLTRYVCSTWRYAKKCKNGRGVKEAELLKAVFDALRDRTRGGADFKSLLEKSMTAELRQKETLARKAEKLKARHARLLDAIERGVDATDRALALQAELDGLQEKMSAAAPPPLPDEAAIRARLVNAIDGIDLDGDVITTRRMFRCLLKEVVLTPIPASRHGETIQVTLKDDGWARFWIMIAGA